VKRQRPEFHRLGSQIAPLGSVLDPNMEE
jgi:hypothetical protein